MNRDQWEWFGSPGHFICADKCRFHLTTKVGKYLVSTVGELWPERGLREIHAKIYDPQWFKANVSLKCDYFDAAYMERFGFEDIGCDRKYETMVFEAGERCDSPGCNCGLPRINGSELDFGAYNSAGEANAGHLALCEKWAKAE